MRVSVLGALAPEFYEELKERTRDYSVGQPQLESDVVIHRVSARTELHEIDRLAGVIKQNGAIWVVFPKGVKTVTAGNVREAGLAAGLVDNKVISFSPVLTGLRFVIPVKARKK